eukprot:3085091-Lingulodinium_polyedra.AAC.1
MRSRQQIRDTIAGPTYQHAANQLIYSHEGNWHTDAIEEVGRRIRAVLPVRTREPWHHLNRRGRELPQ